MTAECDGLRREVVYVAALLATHNRKAQTLACLGALAAQRYTEDVVCHAYLVDSGSSDGTVEAVRERFPEVTIVCASEMVFWCGAMRIAWSRAMAKRCHYLLLLNDDTVLMSHAIQLLLRSERQARELTGRPALVAGSTLDPATNRRSYGGVRRGRRRGDVVPSDSIQPCDQTNCNCTIVPVDLAQAVGEFDGAFTHALADHDYSLRAKAKGFSAWVAPGYLGTCQSNPVPAWADPRVPLRRRWKALHSPKGLPPREWIVFCRRHLPYQWPLRAALLYLHALLPRLWLQAQDGPSRP